MVKTITIKTEVYEKLVRAKKARESFSELFERLLEMTSPMYTLSKMRGSMTFKNKRKMLAEIYASRKEWRQ
ncbi:MAG: antitoxin VapB family protein [Candidatus Micrarchaeota archaeon]|nr:antitoxin VapB family protein [Candidatus Micrarchaeota archaeon]